MPATFLHLAIMVAVFFAVGIAGLWVILISVVSLPGTLVYMAMKNRSTKVVGIVIGCALVFVGQLALFGSFSAYAVAFARHQIEQKGGWPWVIWPIGFLLTALTLATGAHEAERDRRGNPELGRNPMYIMHPFSLLLGIGAFIAFAVFRDSLSPAWTWLPGL